MTEAPHQIFRFEAFTLDIAAAELRKDGVAVPVEPQVFDLLVLLVTNHERVVTKDEIIASVWSGRIVSESAISSRINAARRALDDDGAGQRLIRTVHGRGFRFGAVPEAAPIGTDGPQALQTPQTTKPSIAVTPFTVMSENPELVFFADGIAEDIINALSRFHELSVIARNSSFAFKGRAVRAREIADTLGVKYVLEGSVRAMGPRIRVAVQLIDASADRTLWSDRYDGELTDIFDVQDEITAKAVAAIAPQTQYAEMTSAARKDATSLSDWERIMRARWHMDRYTREDTDSALAILGEVLETDPDLALAHSTAAACHTHRMLNMWCEDTGAEIGLAEAAARRAVSLDAFDASALAVLGLAALLGRRYEECMDRLEEAVRLNPNLATGYGFMATAYGCMNEVANALAACDRAMLLSPADPTRTLWMSGKGIGLYFDGQFEAVLENATRMLQIDPTSGPALRQRAAALSRLGRLDEARAAMARVLEAMPNLTATRLSRMVPVRDESLEGAWLDSLRAIGLPD